MVIGWADAGYVGIRGIEYIEEELDAQLVGEIDLSPYIPMPKSRIDKGVMRRLEFPKGELSLLRDERIILFKGEVPKIKQIELAREIVELALELCVRRIYTIGGFQAPTHHLDEPRVLGVVNKAELKEELSLYGIDTEWDYYGTTSMNGLILAISKDEGIEGISLWGEVPNYLAGIPYPKITRALLLPLSNMLRMNIDFSDLDEEVRVSQEKINDIVENLSESHPEFKSYLEELRKDRGGIDNLLKEIEDFLRGEDGR